MSGVTRTWLNRLPLVVLAVTAAGFLALGVAEARADAPTFDEPVYVRSLACWSSRRALPSSSERRGGPVSCGRSGRQAALAGLIVWAVYLVLDAAMLSQVPLLVPRPYLDGIGYLAGHDTTGSSGGRGQRAGHGARRRDRSMAHTPGRNRRGRHARCGGRQHRRIFPALHRLDRLAVPAGLRDGDRFQPRLGPESLRPAVVEHEQGSVGGLLRAPRYHHRGHFRRPAAARRRAGPH